MVLLLQDKKAADRAGLRSLELYPTAEALPDTKTFEDSVITKSLQLL